MSAEDRNDERNDERNAEIAEGKTPRPETAESVPRRSGGIVPGVSTGKGETVDEVSAMLQQRPLRRRLNALRPTGR